MSLVVDTHREYLEDPVRIEAFRAAIHERVRPGDIVCDLGAGTGILGLFACQAGAARVYAIESTGMIGVARSIAAANGFADRLRYLHGESRTLSLPEPVDGVVCDQIGRFGFDAGLFDVMDDARRFLRGGGWTVPGTLTLHVAAIEAPDVRRRIDFWAFPIAGLSVAPAATWAMNTGYPVHLAPAQLLGPASAVAELDLPQPAPTPLVMTATLRVERDGTLDGLGGWFSSRLSPGTILTNAPGAPRRLHRRNVVLPVTPAVAVQEGDTIDLKVQVLPADLLVAWQGIVTTRRGRSRFSHSTLQGMLLTPDDVRRLRPTEAPRLTERGRARLSVLQLCDGVRPLEDIERAVRERHPSLFRSATDAAVFVAEVVSRYTQ